MEELILPKIEDLNKLFNKVDISKPIKNYIEEQRRIPRTIYIDDHGYYHGEIIHDMGQ